LKIVLFIGKFIGQTIRGVERVRACTSPEIYWRCGREACTPPS